MAPLDLPPPILISRSADEWLVLCTGIVDGCFWHGCPRCFRLPKQNKAFWKAKIEGNRKRDRSVSGRLRRLGWKVLRIRECQLKHSDRVVLRVKSALG